MRWRGGNACCWNSRYLMVVRVIRVKQLEQWNNNVFHVMDEEDALCERDIRNVFPWTLPIDVLPYTNNNRCVMINALRLTHYAVREWLDVFEKRAAQNSPSPIIPWELSVSRICSLISKLIPLARRSWWRDGVINNKNPHHRIQTTSYTDCLIGR